MSIRTERVARLIQKEVAVLLQTDFFEPSQAMTTVTQARVTPDLSIAYVYISIMGEVVERKNAFKRLQNITSEIRHALAARIRHQVRAIPELRLMLDESQEQAMKMEHLFADLQKEREEKGEVVVDAALYPHLKED
ncbi:MAG TPA: 30S ribosome-binding factor RbfA [Bacteroidetes bacterium]|nr:30S ribosome-binding factor RbfA [Bacteroidota bacterium]HRR07809.1 30S ribosome-binding factor RbfA [Rhodothermales bacterium]